MKKLIIFTLICFFAVFSALPAIAGDPTYLMLRGDLSQDALLVGKVIEGNDKYVLFEVVRTVIGVPAQSPFKLYLVDPGRVNESVGYAVDADINVAGSGFSAGDGILASVKFLEGTKAEGIKAIGNYKVQLMPDKKIKMDVKDFEAPYVEWIVNTGESADSVSWHNGTLYKNKINDFEIVFDTVLFNGEEWLVDSLDPKYKAPEIKFYTPPKPPMILKTFVTYYGTAFVLLTAAACAVIKLAAKNRRKI